MFVLAEQKMILSNNGYVLPNRNWESWCFNHDGKGTFTTFYNLRNWLWFDKSTSWWNDGSYWISSCWHSMKPIQADKLWVFWDKARIYLLESTTGRTKFDSYFAIPCTCVQSIVCRPWSGDDMPGLWSFQHENVSPFLLAINNMIEIPF